MLRVIATAFTLTLIAAPARAQSHPRSHSVPHMHDSVSHVRMDPALHALLHGMWTGNLVSTHSSGGLRLSITHDSLKGAMVKVVSAPAGLSTNASTLAIHGDTLRWRQELADKACPATAILSTRKSTAEHLLKGSVACEGGDMTFVLHKTGD